MRKDAEGRNRFKIVFYGPSLCGKTSTLVWLYHKVDGLEKGKFTQLADPHGRTLFFDFAPMQATKGVVLLVLACQLPVTLVNTVQFVIVTSLLHSGVNVKFKFVALE